MFPWTGALHVVLSFGRLELDASYHELIQVHAVFALCRRLSLEGGVLPLHLVSHHGCLRICPRQLEVYDYFIRKSDIVVPKENGSEHQLVVLSSLKPALDAVLE